MSTTLIIDPEGGLFLPPELLAKAHLSEGARVEVDVTASQIVLKPVASELEARLVEKDGAFVFEGGTPLSDEDVIRGIKADRDDFTDHLLGGRDREA